MKQKCISCGKTITDEAFCPHCSVSQRCLKCNTNFAGNEKFCGKCGEARQNITERNYVEATKLTGQAEGEVYNRPSDRQTGLRKIPPIFWAIALVLVFVVGYLYISGGNDEKSIEKTITTYFEAMENNDVESIYKLVHPDANESKERIASDLESIPADIEIDIDHFFDWEIFEETATVQVVTVVRSEFHNVREKNEIMFELIKEGKNWLIYDNY